MAGLFDPLAIRDLTFANRAFVSPMCQVPRATMDTPTIGISFILAVAPSVAPDWY